MLDYTKEGVACRYQIDGVWHNANPKVRELKKGDPGPVLDRETGDQMLAVLKRISHLKMTERRAKQEGKLRIEFGGNKYDTSLVSQGTPTGERAVLSLALITKTVRTLEDLGMREKLREQLKELIGPGAQGARRVRHHAGRRPHHNVAGVAPLDRPPDARFHHARGRHQARAGGRERRCPEIQAGQRRNARDAAPQADPQAARSDLHSRSHQRTRPPAAVRLAGRRRQAGDRQHPRQRGGRCPAADSGPPAGREIPAGGEGRRLHAG